MKWVCGAVLLGTLGWGSGCLEIQLCDPDQDAQCADESRGQIKGTVSVAGIKTASTHTRAVAVAESMGPARKVLAQAYAEHRQRNSVDQPLIFKSRLPTKSDRNRVSPRLLAKERWRDGEVIVSASSDIRGNRLAWQTRIRDYLEQGYDVEVGLCNTPNSCLLHLKHPNQKSTSNWETWAVAQRLDGMPGLRHAEVNRILQIASVPNDPFYGHQWHYGAMHLEGAWAVTTGSDDVIAAVIDTGVLQEHPELRAKILNSVDLIDDPSVAGDGDGRDNDGEDEGDRACGASCHSHHGTHVAGTMTAQTNNDEMIAGVSWAGQLLAIRSLGRGGGSLFDIAGGLYWAIGDEVDGVARNENPAHVINMSLGGRGESETMNEAVAAATAANAIVIVAAGNEGANADDYTPANAPAAITVAAVGNFGQRRARPKRATYSNTGAVVDLSAPGGEQVEDMDGDGFPDGVLSTVKDFVTYYQGTSMAAPHVAGVAMLLKSLAPAMDQDEVRALLTTTADPNIDCEGCGAGMVNAAKAIVGWNGGLDAPYVVTSPAVARLGRMDLDAEVRVKNISDVDSVLNIYIGGADRDAVTISKEQLNLVPSGEETIAVSVNRSGTDRGSAHLLLVYEDGRTHQVELVWTDAYLNQAGAATVGALRLEEDGSFSVARMVVATALTEYKYHLFNLPAGDYVILGLTDDDDDGELEDHEGVGVYPSIEARETVSIEAGQSLDNVDFSISPGFDPEEDSLGSAGNGVLGDACSSNEDCAANLYCERVLEGGYCTVSCAQGVACPEDGKCFCLSASGFGCDYSICLKSCAADADCREEEGYLCDADQTCYPEL